MMYRYVHLIFLPLLSTCIMLLQTLTYSNLILFNMVQHYSILQLRLLLKILHFSRDHNPNAVILWLMARFRCHESSITHQLLKPQKNGLAHSTCLCSTLAKVISKHFSSSGQITIIQNPQLCTCVNFGGLPYETTIWGDLGWGCYDLPRLKTVCVISLLLALTAVWVWKH